MQYRRPPRRFTEAAIENMRFRYEETDEPQQSIADDYGIHRKTLDRIAKDNEWKLRKHRLPHDIPPAFRIEAEAERALRAQEEARLETAVSLSGEPSTAHTRESGNPESDTPSLPHRVPASAAMNGEKVDPTEPQGREAQLPLADRLEQAVEKELAAIERKRRLLGLRPESIADGERTARTLASLTETLNKIRRLRCPETPVVNAPTPDNYEYDMPADIDEFRLALARRIENFVRSRTGAAVPPAGEPSGPGPSE